MSEKDLASERELAAVRRTGQQLAEFMALFAYFLRETPEGQAVRAEIEADWQATCARLRREKKLIGAEFSLERWLREVQKDWQIAQQTPKKTVTKAKTTKLTKKKVLKFRNIP